MRVSGSVQASSALGRARTAACSCMVVLWLPVLHPLRQSSWSTSATGSSTSGTCRCRPTQARWPAAASFTFPCANDAILERARTYAGDPASSAPYNTQIGRRSDSNVHVLDQLGATTGTRAAPDDTDGGPPCAARMVDVKITETDLPWYFRLATVPAINAHARVEVQGLLSDGAARCRSACPTSTRTSRAPSSSTSRPAPMLALDAADEDRHVERADRLGQRRGAASVPISASRIGVRVALGGGTSTTCGGRSSSATTSAARTGLLHVRGWSSARQRRAAEPAARAQRHALRRLVPRPVLLHGHELVHVRRAAPMSTSATAIRSARSAPSSRR